VALRRDLGLAGAAVCPAAPGGAALPAPGATTAFRLVNSESDFLPGLIVDAYGPFLVVQAHTLGIVRRLGEIVEALVAELQPVGIFQRSEGELREREGLSPETGRLWGEEPPETVAFQESGLRFLADLRGGQKTGFFLDQRENRRRLAALVSSLATPAGTDAKAIEVLNAFAFTGAFGVCLAAANPRVRVLNLESSPEALALGRRNFALNGFADRAEDLPGNAFQLLRRFRDERRQFDVVILDPPKFAQAQGQVPGACRGYKDINLLAFKLLRPGGLLATFSCSGLVSPELFQKVVFSAALDAGSEPQLLARFAAGPDHPVLLGFPEGEYLKGLALRCP